MKREELIKKWLDHDLNDQEQEQFKALSDYDALMKLTDGLNTFKATDYDVNSEYEVLISNLERTAQTSKSGIFKYAMQIAAALIIGFGIFQFAITRPTSVSSLMAQKTEVNLPDDSEVVLNANSTISYSKTKWDDKRVIELNGEAYFKVTKGATFTVSTSQGDVTVLGTEFIVKERDDLFQVVCYEGSVRVENDIQQKILKAGDNLLIIDGKIIATEKESATSPSWVDHESYFKSMPFEFVLNEFERQYNLSIITKDVDLEQYFTGSFVHNDKTLALKSITLPLNLKYRLIDANTIELSTE